MATNTDLIQQLYVAYFNRPADVAGLNYWVGALDGGATIDQVSKSFNNAAEYTAAYAGKSPEVIVDTVYMNLFGRHAEGAGLDYWAPKVQSGAITVADLVKQISAGAVGADGTPNADGAAFANKVTAADAFTVELNTAGNEAERIAYASGSAAVLAVAKNYIAGVTTDASLATAVAGVHAAAQGLVTVTTPVTNFTLTSGVDSGAAFTGSAGNDTFNATGATLTALDSIDGAGGANTLNLLDPSSLLGSGLPSGASIKNVQTFNITTSGSIGAAGSAVVPAVAEQKTYTFGTPVAGTDTIVVNYGGQTTTITTGATATTAGAAFVAAINAMAGSNIATNAAGTVTLVAATAGTPLSNITFSAPTAAGDLPTIASTVANVVGSAATTAVVYDASGVTGLATLTAIANGTVNTKVSDTTNLTVTNSGNGGVTIAGAATANITTGTGAVSITGGEALTSATVVGGSTVAVSDSGNSTLKSVSLSGNTGAATLTSDSLTSVSIAKTAAATTVTNTTAKHSLAVGLNAVTGGVTDLAATNVAFTVTGAKATTASNVLLTDNVVTTVSVDTAAAFTLDATYLATKDTLTTLTVKGAGSFTSLLGGVSSLTSLDMSAGSGKHTVTVDATVAAATIKGGSGADLVTTVGALDAKSSINLGAGSDTYKFDTAAVAGALVNGGDGTDTLAVVDGGLLNAAAAKVYSGFEVLEIGGGKAGYDMSLLGLTSVTLTGAALAADAQITNAAANTTLAITSAAHVDLATTNKLSYALKDATGTADALTVSLNAVDGNNDGTAQGNITVASLTANAIEKVTIASTASVDVDDATTVGVDESVAAKSYTNTITTLVADSAKSLVLTGAASTTIVTINSDTLTKIDATAATGNITITNAVADAANGAAKGAVTFLGGSGADTYTATAKGDVIAGGAGADVITLAGGKDTVALTKASDSVLTLKDTNADGISDTKTGFDMISNFTTASDTLDISSMNIGTGAARGAITLHTLSADNAAALQSSIGTGVGFFNDGVANRALSLVAGGGQSYLFIDANGDGNYTAGTDAVVKLVGITSIVLGDVAFG